MAEKIAEMSMKREAGYLYFVKTDERGLLAVYKAKLARGGRKKKKK